jgi:hypothetical protein
MERHGVDLAQADTDLAMNTDELLAYLRIIDCDSFTPLQAILAHTEAIGDPAAPSREQTAVLKWVGMAIHDWEQQFPLEEPLAGQLRRLKPLVAAVAVTDHSFLTPGAHPLHQLLDTFHQLAIGWQPRLGRAGHAVEEQARKLVDTALTWFVAHSTDLAAVARELAASAASAGARSSRMAQRLVEAETGRLRLAASKRNAAAMINAALEEFLAPPAIGEFLKGPWYESVQLVLLKFGEASNEWEGVSLTTTKLLASMQSIAPGEKGGTGRRQLVFEMISHLQDDLRRWHISIRHDSEDLGKAMALVESFHSKVLRQQAVELERIPPILLDEDRRADQYSGRALEKVHEGQWFLLDIDNDPPVRATLAARIETDQQLLFTNQAGVKVLQLGFAEFDRLMTRDKVRQLDSGASFSRSLARSAGIVSQEDLDEVTGVAAERARLLEEQRQATEQERARLEREEAERARIEFERLQREQERLDQLRREQEAAERQKKEREEAARRREEQTALEYQRHASELLQLEHLQRQWEEAARGYRDHADIQREQTPPGLKPDNEAAPNDSELTLPSGTWLGFRDGDKAVLARLAVYDRERNHYTFVDRYGVKLRQLASRELLLLFARGLTDILETRPTFRDEVRRVQKRSGSQDAV